ncbi:beta-1,3-galactosyltransferase 5-like [Sphaerodactylus townsendi]|uniref:beta-1,3-galactosyltransferase 5-like n=1 Tax=Sphaerodactylus townsendi TaxID=933632 RepID=UPI002025E244|nr:beta-1,3-galactosyltransferase 5-like [Sphaerodactylus townsendi]
MFKCIGICSVCLKDMSIFQKNNHNFLKMPDMDCKKNPPFLIILVTSHRDQIKTRMAIRETWGKERIVTDKRIVTFFLLGSTSYDGNAVMVESLVYKDIIQKDFLDTYNNLTLKILMGLEWVHKFCPQSSFVMKTDSDTFVNTLYLTELLLKRNRTTRFFAGASTMHSHPVRDPRSRWYVSKEEYPWNKFPRCCSGAGYVFSTDVSSHMYIVSQNISFLKLEDVFVGLCLAYLKIKVETLHSEPVFFVKRIEFSPCRYRKLVTSHFVTYTEMLMYWYGLEKSRDEECSGGHP